MFFPQVFSSGTGLPQCREAVNSASLFFCLFVFAAGTNIYFAAGLGLPGPPTTCRVGMRSLASGSGEKAL
jgi:hypothetical protein